MSNNLKMKGFKMKKTILMAGAASLLILVGCGENSPKGTTIEKTQGTKQASVQTNQNILDYTKTLKLNEPVEITDTQSYIPGTIEYMVWRFITTMDSGNYKDCLSLMVVGEYDDLAMKMWYDASFQGHRWDLNKSKSFTLKDFNGTYSCIFEGFSNKDNKNRKASYYIVIKDGKVWLTGKDNVKTF